MILRGGLGVGEQLNVATDILDLLLQSF